jgi:hypothetical protein
MAGIGAVPGSSQPAPEEISKLYVEPAGEITKDNTSVDVETNILMLQAQAAVKLVLDDCASADNYININQWPSGWTLADTLYQSPAASTAFDGGNVAQANVPKFMVSNHISSIIPKVMGGIFYEKPPFELRPRPGTTQTVVEAKKALFTTQLDLMHFEEEVELFAEHMALFGTGIMKWGYSEYKEKRKTYSRKKKTGTFVGATQEIEPIHTAESDEFVSEVVEVLHSRPWIKFCDIRTVLVDPGTRIGDIRKAKWVIYRDYATFSDLGRLRNVPGYNIPDEDVLRGLYFSKPTSGPDNITLTIPEGMYGYLQHALPRSYKTSANPQETPIEILERWDKERVIVIMTFDGHNILIRNEANPYGRIPFFSANWRNIPDCFYGQGLGILIGSEQLVEQGVTNLSLDLISYCLQPPFVRKKGFNTPTQNIRWKQGGIIDVDDDVDKAFRILEMPSPPAAAYQAIQQSQAAAAASSGANEQVVQGASSAGIKSTGMRSGTGAAGVIQANASRLDNPISRIIRQVFEPWLATMDELNNDLLPTSVLNRILGEKMGKDALKSVDHIDFRNAQLEYEVLAGAHLGAKKEMAQFFPILMQLFAAPAFNSGLTQAGVKWNYPQIFKMYAAAAGWKYSQEFLIPMTAEEIKQRDANSPAGIQARQAQAQQEQQQQKFQQEQALQEQEQLGKASNEVVRAATEHALQPEISGEPTTTGVGSSTEI